MNKINLFVFILIGLSTNLCAQSLEKMTEKLLENLALQKNTKLAVLAVDYGEGLSSEDAKVVYYRLVNAVNKTRKVTLIERVQLDKVLQELKLQASGVTKSDNLVRFGEVSGADYVLLSSINRLKGKNLEVSSRVIETLTSKVLGTGKTNIKKDWGEAQALIEENTKIDRERIFGYISDWTKQISMAVGQERLATCYYSRGYNCFLIKDYNCAIADFEHAITIGGLNYPDLPQAYYYLGRAQGFRKKYPESIESLKSALELHLPVFAEKSAYETLTAACVLIKDHECVIRYATEGLQLYPSFEKLLYFRGGAQMVLANYDAALGDITKALELGISKTSGYNALSWLYFDTAKYPLALEYFNKQLVLSENPSPDVYIGIALANYKMDNLSAAEVYFNKAVLLNSNYDGKFENTGLTYSTIQLAAMKELHAKLSSSKL